MPYYLATISLWAYIEIIPRVDPYTLREGTGLDLALHRFDFFDDLTRQYSEREYEPEAAYFPVDKTKPHVACFVIDSKVEPENQVLCSEVDYAAELVRFRLEKGEHTGHHTKPVRFPPFKLPLSNLSVPYYQVH